MTKILHPSLRLGCLVAPEQLVDSLAKIRSVIDQHSPTIDQATLARFITEGFFLSHVKRMRKLYADRREFFIREFNRRPTHAPLQRPSNRQPDRASAAPIAAFFFKTPPIS